MDGNAASLNAAQLKKRFAVYGTFYQWQVAGQEVACRSLLELVSHDIAPAALARHVPDLAVVMMNPGSSHPLDMGYTPPLVKDMTGLRPLLHWVATRPDNTQYQIMRLMAARGYGHARVMNLSDLRQPKSNLLMTRMAELALYPTGDRHSIFCDARQTELHHLLPPAPAPVIVGWGRHPALLPLARLCLQRLQGRTLVGVKVGEGLYSHPSPMLQRLKDQWVAEVLQQLVVRTAA